MIISTSLSRREGHICSEKEAVFLGRGGFIGVSCVTDVSCGRTFRRDEVCLMSTWTSYKVCDNSDWFFFFPSWRQTFPSLSSHVCSIASLSVFIEFYGYKRIQGIFLWKDMILPHNYIPLSKTFFPTCLY